MIPLATANPSSTDPPASQYTSETSPISSTPGSAETAGKAHLIVPLYGETTQEPPPPVPKLQTSSSDILTQQKTRLSQHEITFQKLAPLRLPTPPAAPVTENQDEQNPSGEANAEQKPHSFIMISASVCTPDQEAGHALTFLQLWSSSTQKPISLWVNANFLWLTGFAEYETPDARYALLMAISAGGVDTPGNLHFPSDEKASLIVTDGEPTESELRPIHALLEIYNDPAQLDRLKQSYALRQQEADRMAAERAADPPEKRPIRLQYWRLDQAGLDGATPKPASIQ